MRLTACVLAALCLLVGFDRGRGADGDEAAAILDKAVKATLGDSKDVKKLGYRGKNKGTIHVLGMELEFTSESWVQVPEKFKEVVDMTIGGQKITVASVFDGKKGWIKANDANVDVNKEVLDEFKDVAYLMGLSQGIFVRDKTLKLSLLGEVNVNGKPAVGVKISRDGKKEVDFYFDKATGLTAKVERRTRDFQTGQEVTEERILLEYRDQDGRKVPKKVLVNRDGKKYLEAEVLEMTFVEKLDDGDFAQP